METKKFKGKAIYRPAGKAAEYAEWACNFYKGCSNGCTYCYLKKGVLAHAMGGDKPELKACFKDEAHALEVFEKELLKNIDELRKHGMFFSFTTDPMLPETWLLTFEAINVCRKYDVPFKILTKRTDWFIDEFIHELKTNGTIWNREPKQHLWAFGFTLTGHDELEPGASTNAERIEAMKKLHNVGFKTFASIEPIIDFESSRKMIEDTLPFCDLYKIGLESGKRYKIEEVHLFLHQVSIMTRACQNKIYFKDSFLNAAKMERQILFIDNCVERDYNLFK